MELIPRSTPMPNPLLPSPAQVQAARDYCAQQRQANGLDPNPDGPGLTMPPLAVVAMEFHTDQAKRAEALETLTIIIVNEYGPERVGVWVQNIDKLRGAK